MAQRAITKTTHHSFRAGPLTEGCKRCVRGEKLVMFVTGVCPARCFYCPISSEKKQKDIEYANERRVKSPEDLLQEARDCRATGAGFTGGDPLARIERTCRYISLLKEEFGKGFHIHLYTPLNLVNEERLDKLYSAGLDEIRFHPDIADQKWWGRILLARAHPWKVGVEIPVLPDKVEEAARLIDFLDGKIDFLNLNELEISELNEGFFRKLGYRTKDYSSYGVEGSDSAAMELMRRVRGRYPVHYCTCKLKDLVQMGNRLKRRAANTKLPIDIVDEEGLVLRGAIYAGLVPGFGYEKAIEHLSDDLRSSELARLEKMKDSLVKTFRLVEGKSVFLDAHKPRLLVSAKWLRKNHCRLPHPCAVVLEYPTFDSFPIEIEFLNKA